MKNFKFKNAISISLISSLMLCSPFLPCNAEKISDDVLLSDNVSANNMLFLNAYYNPESCMIFSELCVFSDERMPEIYCSYDNENFSLTNASIENNFSFVPDKNFDEIYVKATQTFGDGTVFESDTVKVSIDSNAFTAEICADHGDDLGYIPDEHLGESITVIPYNFAYLFYLYPDGSYFSETGKACTCHSYCNWNNPGNCTVFDKAIQCDGFGRKVYYEVHDTLFSSKAQTPYNANLTAAKAKSLFKGGNGVNMGTYLRVKTNNGYEHSIVITYTSDTSVTVYHANYGGSCLVRYQTYTWDNFAAAFPHLYYYVK